jgi:quercetin 2,3-dioxygenase
MSAVLGVQPLGFPWETIDPFLFCVHHDDAYPAGNEEMGPAASLAGRELGQDFAGVDGWRMYHGERVPGFPPHPHRGFETVTVVRRGFVDHSDSLGATARYGAGDTQWLTAGGGIVHAEMFPLLERHKPNPLELFQIWLNLPRAHKMAKPHFTMFWRDRIPIHTAVDPAGRRITITIVAGALSSVLGGGKPPPPPPHSWAAQPENEVAIWTIAFAPGAQWSLPPASPRSNRTLYFFKGAALAVDGREVPVRSRVRLRPDATIALINGGEPGEALLLQGRPIGEPVVSYGPFVMNSEQEIQQAFADYRRTQFGGWPWPTAEPVHPRTSGRFAIHADGHRDAGR